MRREIQILTQIRSLLGTVRMSISGFNGYELMCFTHGSATDAGTPVEIEAGPLGNPHKWAQGRTPESYEC